VLRDKYVRGPQAGVQGFCPGLKYLIQVFGAETVSQVQGEDDLVLLTRRVGGRKRPLRDVKECHNFTFGWYPNVNLQRLEYRLVVGSVNLSAVDVLPVKMNDYGVGAVSVDYFDKENF